MTNKRTEKIAIVGGGIAGCVAAIALQRAGFKPAVYEATEDHADGLGAFLSLAPNGMDALAALGVAAADLGGFPTPRIAMYLGNGCRLAEMPSGPTDGDRSHTITLKRSDLYAALRKETLRRGIAIRVGKRLVSARANLAGAVEAHFADGSEALADVLIGADGLGSRVRNLIDSRAPRASYTGLLNTGGFARGVEVPGEPGVLHMVFGKRCFFGYVVDPIDDVWWFANPSSKRELSKAELAATSQQRLRGNLLELFSSDRSPAIAIIEATQGPLPLWSTYDLASVPTWHNGNMVLIGDAAHAMSPSSGQGASMAIEDAVVLAMCLRDIPRVPAAFAHYEHLRRARVERAVELGRRNGDGKTPGPLGRTVRDLALRLVLRRMASARAHPTRWLFDYPFELERSVTSMPLLPRSALA